MKTDIKINSSGFREYDARWLYKKDINLFGLENLGKGLGTQIIKNTKNCYLSSEARLVVGIGLEDLIVVETNDAILVSNKRESQKVKEIVKILRDKKIPEGLKHSKIYRPWGHYKTIIEEDRWQVKLIEVKSGGKLSLQMHHHRSEYWIIVKGTAEVEVNGKNKIFGAVSHLFFVMSYLSQ